MKRNCSKCGVEFEPRYKKRYLCDDCWRIYRREWVRAHPEGNRANVKRWRKANPEKYKKLNREMMKRYYYRKLQKYIEEHPELNRAKVYVCRAKTKGEIEKSPVCEVCGRSMEEVDIRAHTLDKDYPVDTVIWVCRDCNPAIVMEDTDESGFSSDINYE